MLKILISAGLLLFSISVFSQSQRLDSLLIVLKSEIQKEQEHDSQKYNRIERLKRDLAQHHGVTFKQQYSQLSAIFDEYRSFKFDSAYTWVNRMASIAIRSGDRYRLFNAQILKGNILMGSGYYKEAFDLLAQVDTNHLSKASISDLYFLRARLNAAIGNYNNNTNFSNQYLEQSDRDFKVADVNNSGANEFENIIDLAFKKDSIKGTHYTANYFYNYITSHHLLAHNLAMVSTRLSYAYTGHEKAIFLALAAINDIRSSAKENSAIMMLGQEMYRMNRFTDAYQFIQEAISNASFYGARGHAIQAGEILPIIASKIIAQKQHDKDRLLLGLLVFMIAAIALFFALYIYRKQLKLIQENEQVIREKNQDLERINKKLKEASRVKEELIGLFFKTSSSHLEKMDKVTRKTQHSIKLGKYSEANTILKSINIEKEKTDLYETLDKVFLTLFPNFPASFNALLKEKDQIWPKEGEALNPTLRIFALIRLGVTDMQAVARILDYSISTVYTYKARVKAKALISPEEFERQVMNIEFLDQ
jgi:tetratricopeptide (TPR) repeat protein